MYFWSLKIAILMIASNLFCIILGRYAIQIKSSESIFPFQVPDEFKGFGVAELLATSSLGHILGAGLILGLSQLNLVN
uniref:Photosystem I reaction center subunit PsaK n=1 Tax=Gloeochaete wittrockiana TaxID=38269 RepID=A0A3G1IW27_9EUKA|nr:photosystem I reaction center subunit PsaK [Gloeochaete wittrockiana]ASQ40149.1 photosystem I reaction center subunit PsaK [Gloeochaete wittrockiana]